MDKKGDAKADTKVEGKEVEKRASQAAEAKAFVDRVDGELRTLAVAAGKAEWDKNTNITDATEKAAADANEKLMEFMAKTIKEATTFTGSDIDPETARKLHLLKVAASPPPAPGDADKRKRLAELGAKMEGIYGKGKACEGTGSHSALRA